MHGSEGAAGCGACMVASPQHANPAAPLFVARWALRQPRILKLEHGHVWPLCALWCGGPCAAAPQHRTTCLQASVLSSLVRTRAARRVPGGCAQCQAHGGAPVLHCVRCNRAEQQACSAMLQMLMGLRKASRCCCIALWCEAMEERQGIQVSFALCRLEMAVDSSWIQWLLKVTSPIHAALTGVSAHKRAA